MYLIANIKETAKVSPYTLLAVPETYSYEMSLSDEPLDNVVALIKANAKINERKMVFEVPNDTDIETFDFMKLNLMTPVYDLSLRVAEKDGSYYDDNGKIELNGEFDAEQYIKNRI